ncbi:MAG: 50S ribosomal protein L15e, partial [Candidatus Micrarchaeota archaeon]
VLNSYWVGEDGSHSYFEIILVDRTHPNIKNDFPNLGRGRAARGLTSIGRKGRGLLHKGTGAEKIRPSVRAQEGRGK